MRLVFFIFSCIILFIQIYAGFVPSKDDSALIYTMLVLNTMILVFIMGVLAYG